MQLHSFLTSTLDAGEWSNLRPGRFKSGKVPAVPIALETLYDSRVDLDSLEKSYVSSSCKKLNYDSLNANPYPDDTIPTEPFPASF